MSYELTADLLGFLFKLGGVGFVLVAAVGVLRLPDPLLRMHAATKAGTVGTGLVLLGVAVTAPDAGTAVTAILAILFLLATLPIASHLLARAAYVSGEEIWEGTGRDDLAGVLARRAPLRELPAREMPPRAVPAARQPSPPPEPVAEQPTRGVEGLPDPGGALDPGRRPLNRVLFAIVGPDPEPALAEAIRTARPGGTALAGLSLIDSRILADADDHAVCGDRLRATMRARLSVAMDRVEALLRQEGLPADMHLEEGEVAPLLRRLRQADDLLVLPARGWFHHGVEVPSECYSRTPDSMLWLAAQAVGPLLLTGGDERPVRRVLVLDDGGTRVPLLTAWMVQHGLWADADLSVAALPALGGDLPDARRGWYARLCAAAGRPVGFLPPVRPATGAPLLNPALHGADALVMSRIPGPQHCDWYGSLWLDRLLPGWRGRVLLP